MTSEEERAGPLETEMSATAAEATRTESEERQDNCVVSLSDTSGKLQAGTLSQAFWPPDTYRPGSDTLPQPEKRDPRQPPCSQYRQRVLHWIQ